MFQIKICGITNEDDAKMAVEAGADALGLNFYPEKFPFHQPRKPPLESSEVIPPKIVKVGVFVNEAVEVVAKTFDTLGLDLIQLHGDEPPEYLGSAWPSAGDESISIDRRRLAADSEISRAIRST